MERADTCEAFAHDRDRFVGVVAPHGDGSTHIQREREEPRACKTEYRDRFVEQPLGGCNVARRQLQRRHPCQRVADAPRAWERPVAVHTVSEVLPGRVHLAR